MLDPMANLVRPDNPVNLVIMEKMAQPEVATIVLHQELRQVIKLAIVGYLIISVVYI